MGHLWIPNMVVRIPGRGTSIGPGDDESHGIPVFAIVFARRTREAIPILLFLDTWVPGYPGTRVPQARLRQDPL
eukprot:780203-Rhodomonas_salina.1